MLSYFIRKKHRLDCMEKDKETILYGVSVGPGDPELLTLKAVKTIEQCSVIAYPVRGNQDSTALHIVEKACPEIEKKKKLPLSMPMTSDEIIMRKAHDDAVTKIETYLREGEDVAFLVLGDVSIYSTFIYLKELITSRGFKTMMVPGVTSFCAAASVSSISLCQWDEKLVIIPSKHYLPENFEEGMIYVLLKAGKCLPEIREKLMHSTREVYCIENCGMEQEKIYKGIGEIPEQLGYYSLVLIR